MGEITLEKKKQIENYIVASYFDRCKNVESYIGGCDIVYGSKNDDIPDILVEVEDFSGSGFMVVRWNIIHDQVSEWQNEFMIRIARELSITRNRCDSVDAMGYAFVSWKKQLEEKAIFLNDKRIKDLEKEIKELQTENQQLKKKVHELDPIPEFEDNHICGGQRSVNGWRGVSSFWRLNYKKLSELVGFSSVEEIQDYLTNEAECDTLHEAILKLHDEVTYICEKLCSANSENNSWKAAAECNSPKELMTKLNSLRDDIKECKEKYDQAIEIIGKWQRATGQLLPNVDDNELAAWKKATGCSTPEEANKKLSSYEGRLDSVKQSASIAIRHLDNIVFRDDKRSDWSDK